MTALRDEFFARNQRWASAKLASDPHYFAIVSDRAGAHVPSGWAAVTRALRRRKFSARHWVSCLSKPLSLIR